MAHGTGPVLHPTSANLKDHNTVDCKHQLGAVVHDSGHCYMYVKATAAISANEAVVMQEALLAFDTPTGIGGNALGDRATEKYPYIEDTGQTWTAGAYDGAHLYIDAGTGAGQMKRIIKNTATRIYYGALHPGFGEAIEGDAFSTAPAVADSDFTVIAPFHVIKVPADTLTSPIIGNAPFAFTSGYYGWICVRGCTLSGSGTTGAALVAGVGVSAGDNTAGQVTGLAADETIDDINLYATALHAAADDQAAPLWIAGKAL